MRQRALIALSGIVAVLVVAVAFLALWREGPHSRGVVSVSLVGLSSGDARAVTVALPDEEHTKARIFVVRRRSDRVDAFLGVSTHLGCRLLLPGDRRYGEGFTLTSRLQFLDPCGGSTYALNGDCVGGPCPRGLDRYALAVRDDTAEIDLNHLIKGPRRGS
jgi:Rieske Fe-S protein